MDVIFNEKKRLISLVLVLLLVGVFEPKCPFRIGHWGKFLYNVHIAIFHPRMHIANWVLDRPQSLIRLFL
jgi:hypothetical protein